MKEFLGYLGYAKLLGYASLGIIVITYLVHRIFKEYRWAKYIPGLISILIGIYGFITLVMSEDWIKGIINMVTILIGLGSGAVGLFFALILGVYNKPRKVDESVEDVETEVAVVEDGEVLVEKLVDFDDVVEDKPEEKEEILVEKLVDIEEVEILGRELVDIEEVEILEEELADIEEVEILEEELADIEEVEILEEELIDIAEVVEDKEEQLVERLIDIEEEFEEEVEEEAKRAVESSE